MGSIPMHSRHSPRRPGRTVIDVLAAQQPEATTAGHGVGSAPMAVLGLGVLGTCTVDPMLELVLGSPSPVLPA